MQDVDDYAVGDGFWKLCTSCYTAVYCVYTKTYWDEEIKEVVERLYGAPRSAQHGGQHGEQHWGQHWGQHDGQHDGQCAASCV